MALIRGMTAIIRGDLQGWGK